MRMNERPTCYPRRCSPCDRKQRRWRGGTSVGAHWLWHDRRSQTCSAWCSPSTRTAAPSMGVTCDGVGTRVTSTALICSGLDSLWFVATSIVLLPRPPDHASRRQLLHSRRVEFRRDPGQLGGRVAVVH